MTQRTWAEFFRKLGAILLVLSSVTIGIVGLGLVSTQSPSSGAFFAGIGCLCWTPVGIWLATRLTPEGGTSGYCDQNL